MAQKPVPRLGAVKECERLVRRRPLERPEQSQQKRLSMSLRALFAKLLRLQGPLRGVLLGRVLQSR